MSLGAGRPGMSAVVITMSHSAHCCANSSISAAMNSGDISLLQQHKLKLKPKFESSPSYSSFKRLVDKFQAVSTWV